MPEALVIGSGFAGLSAATSLAGLGFRVRVLEKNDRFGGRARVLRDQGFTFDMGPSWYWMPEVFEDYFLRNGSSVEQHYDLIRLDPSYKVIFGHEDQWDIPADMRDLEALFASIEPGADRALRRFLNEARVKYELGMNELVRRPALSWTEFMLPRVLGGMLKVSVFSSLRKHVAAHFKDPRLRQLMEFPVLFLGATPQNTPALYSLMNYADMSLGTWYPMGGMGRIVDAMVELAKGKGVHLDAGMNVEQILVRDGRAAGVVANGERIDADVVISAADYHHAETLLEPRHRSYSESYWSSRTMAPSSLLFYLGFDRKLPELAHHDLFFDQAFDQHAKEIYETPQWPTAPLIYASCTSRTDPSVAPPGHENVVVLIPVAPGLEDTPVIRDKYFRMAIERLNKHTGKELREHLVVHHSYCINDFVQDYNSYAGNAYGLANTLGQTAVLKPRMKSKKVKGLYFTGQLTAPGPGVPPTLISGQVVAELIAKEHGRTQRNSMLNAAMV
ncbi:MAG: phytoene desaturase [Flavobacteriales bacterium]|nr:phytoene desaturase [Flavobacteriales bacterium]